MRLRIPFIALVGAIAAVLAFAAPAAAQDEFVVQRSASFDLVTIGNVKAGCTGEVWAGRTASGSVQAATTVRCPGERVQLQTQLSIYPPNGFGIPFDWASGCEFCSSFTIAGSEQGGPGWCAFGIAEDARFFPGNKAVSYSGSASVCV